LECIQLKPIHEALKRHITPYKLLGSVLIMQHRRLYLRVKTLYLIRLFSAGICLSQFALCLGQSPQKANTTAKNESLPHYDIVSIRPSNPEDHGSRIGGTPDGFSARNVSIAVLLTNTYNLREDSIVGIPASLNSKRFDLVAKIIDSSQQTLDSLSGEQRQKMLEAVLNDRFALKSHKSTKLEQVYVLTQAKSGAKIKPSGTANKPAGTMAPGTITVLNGHIKAHAIPIVSFIGSLAGAVESDVLDETKLQGVYDFDFTWDPDLSGGALEPGATSSAVDNGPSLFTALEEELGLKLVPAKRRMPILVVDHLEMPSPN
jgi:uncharacterized protein (TIGR03435 family)